MRISHLRAAWCWYKVIVAMPARKTVRAFEIAATADAVVSETGSTAAVPIPNIMHEFAESPIPPLTGATMPSAKKARTNDTAADVDSDLNSDVDSVSHSSHDGVDILAENIIAPQTCCSTATSMGNYDSPVRKIPPINSESSPQQPQHRNPPSPSHRDVFLASLQVAKVNTNLSTVKVVPGARLNFEGTVVVVYPCETNPLRRYVMFADEHGTLGITFWNENASKFNSSIVGTVVQVTKVLLTEHEGKKNLTMSKESGLIITNQISPYWTQLAKNPVLSIVDVHSMPVNSFVSVAGILGYLYSERKIVKNVEKDLVIIKLVDRTGQIEVQSWVSKVSDFSVYRDRPVQFQRLRVCAFAGIKCLEIIDGNGTQVTSNFENSRDLANFWNEPVHR